MLVTLAETKNIQDILGSLLRLNGKFLDEYLEQGLVGAESLKQSLASSLEDNINNNMPFLQMLESVESPQFIPFKEPSFVESCVTVTHDLVVETQSSWGVEKVSYECNIQGEDTIAEIGTRERRRKRKTKNKEDVEKQRMTHIAVERNRRRQMNDHLTLLKSLMPSSYLQRGDHASIIGGAIDFVKELEQLLQSLEAQKRLRKNEKVGSSGLFEHGNYEEVNCGDEIKAEKNSEAVAVEVTVIQNHVDLKVECLRRHGQLIKAIVALEELKLTILHLNVTSSQATVLYSFNLKIEEDSKVVSASEIEEAVDHIFRSINDS